MHEAEITHSQLPVTYSAFNDPMEFSYLTVLAVLAMGLLVSVTGGVAYLTAMEWRDRRQQEREKKQR